MSSVLISFVIIGFLFYSVITRAQECGEPQNCIVSEWNDWSECSKTCGDSGTRSRIRVVFQEASCGGSCPYDISETESCNIYCCPVDCTFTPWSDWVLCYCTDTGCEEDGVRYKCSRQRDKLSNASCGGYCDDISTQEACGYLCCYQDCVLSQWSFWSTCDAPCEQPGINKRTRYITQQPICGGKVCGSTEEYGTCMGSCCPVHCVIGEWGQWTECNTTCGQATQTRHRFVQLSGCNGDPCPEDPIESETRPCSNYVNVDCQVGAWSTWTTCYLDNGFCGKGSKFRSRKMITSPVCQGAPCSNLTETGECSGQCCRTDCEVTIWSEWGHCSSSCGQGVSNRTRSVVSWPSCDGSPCPATMLESRGCVVTDVIHCEFTDWSNWTTCSNDCGEGVVIRSRSMITPAYCGGSCESEMVYEENQCESYTALQDCEVTEWSEWTDCERTCEGGIERRNRTVIANPICGGTECPNITESRTCHELCGQLCTGGVCRCELGYRLNSDNTTCTEVSCPLPRLQYCPETHRYLKDCRYPTLECLQGQKYNATCSADCPTDWTLKGSPQFVRCREDGTWSQPLLYCARPNDPPVGIEVDNTQIEENTPKDKCIAYLHTTTTDRDTYEKHTYNITDTDTGRLYATLNRVCLTRTANFEEKPTKWNVTIHSYDIEGQSVSVVFEFEILNANDPPTSVKLEPNTIPENSPNGTVVGCFVGTDDEVGQTITFNMVDSDHNTFITYDEGGQKCLKVARESDPLCSTEGGTYCVLNRELRPVHQVTVVATDDGTPPMSAVYDVPIYLSDVNDKQTAVVIQPDKIPENIQPGDPLVQLVAVDEDGDQTFTFRLIDDSGGIFQIKDSNIIATESFDYEKKIGSSYEIAVEAKDTSNPTFVVTSKLKLFVQDVNEPPYDLKFSSIGGSHSFELNLPEVQENSQGVIGTVSVMDQDIDDAVNISINHNDNTIDHIELSTIKCARNVDNVNICTVKVMLVIEYDYEELQEAALSFTATDTAGLNITLGVQLDILNMNDPPKGILFNGEPGIELSVPENQHDFEIAKLTVLDDDVTDKHEFEIVDSDIGTFLIDGAILKTTDRAIIDFEQKDMYNLTIHVTDDWTPQQTSVFNVTVIVSDENENPTSTTLSRNTVPEHTPYGSVVGEFTTTDPDNIVVPDKQHFVYTLSDNSMGRFYIDGNALKIKESAQMCGIKPCHLDFETERTVSLTVITMDDGIARLQREDKLVIYITDDNDPPTDIHIDVSNIKENNIEGQVIGTLSSFDEDKGETATYTVDDFTDVFEVQDGNKLIAIRSLNYEMLNSYWLGVTATDTGNPPSKGQGTVIIHVINVNEEPTFSNLTSVLTIGDDAVVNRPVASFTVHDPDTGDKIDINMVDFSETFALGSPNCTVKLRTGSTECIVNIMLEKELDVVKRDTYTVVLSISDRQGLGTNKTVTITITDVNNAPSDILLDGLPTQNINISENFIGKIATLSTLDKDFTQTHTYELVNNPNGYFEIDGKELKIANDADVDFETTDDNLMLQISVIDSGNPPLSYVKNLSMIIIDVNEPPSNVLLSPNTVTENSLSGTVVGSLTITDPEQYQNHTLKLVNDAHGIFILDGNTLKINNDGIDCDSDNTVGCVIDYESKSKYTLTVEVLDTGTPLLIGVFDVDVLVEDVNERPRNIRLDENKFILGSPPGTVIGTLSVEDDDMGQTHIFGTAAPSDYISVSGEGVVTVLDSGDLTVGQTYIVSIEVSDNGPSVLSTTEDVTIMVVGTEYITVSINPREPAIQSDTGVNIPETTPAGTTIAGITLQYPVPNSEIDVEVLEGQSYVSISNVQCSNDQGATKCETSLTLSSRVHYETMKYVDVVFQSSNAESKSLDYMRITIQNKNEAPTSVVYSTGIISVMENSHNQLLGQFTVTDPDIDDTHSFTLSGPGADVLTVNEFGRLFTAPDAVIDYESSGTNDLSLTLTVTDVGGLTLTQGFSVVVVDVNEAPYNLSLSAKTVKEMETEGFEVGTFIVDDYDSDQTYSFELISDPSGAFAVTESKLVVAGIGPKCLSHGGSSCLLDFESTLHYTLAVRVTDDGIPPLSAVFHITIDITDVNDPPRAVTLSSTKFLETRQIGDHIAYVSAVDDDPGQTLAFSMTDNQYITIEEVELSLKQNVSYESLNAVTVIIIATDNGSPSMSSTTELTIDVVDVNESPYSITLSSTSKSLEQYPENNPTISENVPALSYIGQIVVLDEDVDDSLHIECQSIDVVVRNTECIPVSSGTRCTADLRSAHRFDFEETPSVEFQIVATDKEGLQIKSELTLSTLDANDPPTNIYFNGETETNLTISENSKDVKLGDLSVEDIETDQTYVYTFDENVRFLMISANELWITSAAVLDYELQDKYEFTIIVTDSGEPPESFQLDFVLRITDVNEAPTELYVSSNKVPEDADVGYVVGSFIVVDPDNISGQNKDTFTFNIQNEDSPFTIENNKILVQSPVFDYETQSTLNDVVIVTDSGTPNLSATFTITFQITDINEPPSNIQLSGFRVKENTEIGTLIGHVSARDPDVGQLMTYSITGTDAVSINGGDVVVNGPVDFEADSKFNITIQVVDNGSPPLSLEKMFTIEVTDVNEPPSTIKVIENDNMTIPENTLVGEEIANIQVIDEDLNERIELTISSESEWVELGTLVCTKETTQTECVAPLMLKRVVDYEVGPQKLDLTVLASDKGGLTLQQNIEFLVTNENEPPVDIILDTDIEYVPENTADFVIGTLSSVDQDQDDFHIYIVISPWELFTIIGNKLVTKGVLNYETNANITVNIRSRDNGAPPQSMTKPFVINVKDMNEAPSDITISPTEIGSTAAVGQIVAQITVTDPDNIGRPAFQTHKCVLTPTDHLEIVNSQLQIKVVFPPDVTSYDITVTCSDNATTPLSLSRDFSLSIVENADVLKEIQLLDETGNHEIVVDENTSDIVIGQLSVINSLTKTVIPGNFVFSVSEHLQSEFAVTGGAVNLLEALNYEQEPRVYLQVSATGTDSGGTSVNLNGNFSIKVLDVNEAPTGIGLSGMRAVTENSREGTVIGDLITYDPENYQSYTYTLLGVNYGMVATENDKDMIQVFHIDGDMLKVGTDSDFINYENSEKITLLINTKDSGEPSYDVSSLVHILVNDANDPPTDITLSNSMIAENSTIDTVIGVFSVEDEDVEQPQACELLNLIDVPFKISEDTKLVLAHATLDFELKRTYTVEVSCGDTLLDGTRLKFTKSFVINVTNVNEPPFNVSMSSYVIEENNDVGHVIGEIKAVDLDSTEISITIEEVDDWSFFNIEGDATLVSDTIFDYESSKPFYTITIRAEDEEGASTYEQLEFEIQDVNEAPVEIILDNVLVVENTAPGTVIGRFVTVDPDRNQQFTYSLDAHSDELLIDGDQLFVGEGGIDYETVSSYELSVTSVDSGIPPKSVQQVITITVEDANDPPVAIVTGQIDVIPEDSSINTVLFTFTVDDPDQGQRHSCYVEGEDKIATVISGASVGDDLQLILSASLNYEEDPEITLNLSCTDGEFVVSKQYTIPVGDVNEAPAGISLSGSNTILADAPPGTVIGVLTVQDEDIGQIHTFIINGTHSDVLKISNQNELTLNTTILLSLLTTQDSSLKIVVTVADNGSPIYTYSQSFTIPITNKEIIQDGLPQVAVTNFEIKSTFVTGDIVGALFSKDMVLQSSVQVELSSNPHGLFTIVNNSILVMSKSLDSVTEHSFSIEVTIHDTISFDSETTIITIIVVQDTTCFEEQCQENESCLSVNETFHMCECHEDFSRNEFDVCTKINHCDVADETEGTLCLNGGVCVDDVNSYVCLCEDGFTGIHCEIEQSGENVCTKGPCLNGGICVPNEDGTEYSCTCKAGWSGIHCDVNDDDCMDIACFNDGTCVDRHLTFVCDCDALWKGLRCEYQVDVCRETQCNDTHTCVGRILSEDTFCVGDTYLVKLSYDKHEVNDVLDFQGRLVEFIIRYGRLARLGNPISRKRRQAESVAYNSDVEVYVSEAKVDGDKYVYSIVVIDAEGEPFTREAVLNVLSITCKDINSNDLTEDEFCPTIVAATEADRKPTPIPSKSNGGLIAGLVVMFLFLIIVGAVVAVVIVKKKTSINKINPESRDQIAGSASGYASMPNANDDTNTIDADIHKTSIDTDLHEVNTNDADNNQTTNVEIYESNTIGAETHQENVLLPEVTTIQVLPADSPLNNARYESTA